MCHRAQLWDLFCFTFDLFSILSNIELTSYADDNTKYVFGRNAAEAIVSLEVASNDLMEWFSNKKMKINSDKFHVLTS